MTAINNQLIGISGGSSIANVSCVSSSATYEYFNYFWLMELCRIYNLPLMKYVYQMQFALKTYDYSFNECRMSCFESDDIFIIYKNKKYSFTKNGDHYYVYLNNIQDFHGMFNSHGNFYFWKNKIIL